MAVVVASLAVVVAALGVQSAAMRACRAGNERQRSHASCTAIQLAGAPEAIHHPSVPTPRAVVITLLVESGTVTSCDRPDKIESAESPCMGRLMGQSRK